MLNYHRVVISLSFGLFKEFLYLKKKRLSGHSRLIPLSDACSFNFLQRLGKQKHASVLLDSEVYLLQ